MGVGFQALEGTRTLYPTLLDQMVSQGLINSRAFSLYLNDLEAETGHILFGGVDTKKFTGLLSTLPINRDITNKASQFLISLTGLSISPPNGTTFELESSNHYPLNILLDSGTTFCLLPPSILNALARAVDAIYDPGFEKYVLDCSTRSVKGTINFFFSGVKISVPYDQFFVREILPNGAEICVLAAQRSSSYFILGDSFLRSAYVVYDLVHTPYSF